MKVTIRSYHQMKEISRRQVDHFVHHCWNEHIESAIHPNDCSVLSFILSEDGQMIGYAGLIKLVVQIDDRKMHVGAVSCFCIDPDYRHLGYGSYLFEYLTITLINMKELDLGLFTCSEQLNSFYLRQKRWRLADWILYADNREGYDSIKEKLNVMALAASEAFDPQLFKKKLHIHLYLPDGLFI